MKRHTIKITILSTAILSAVGMPSVSSAYDVPGSLANVIPSVDVYHTSCFTWNSVAVTTPTSAAFGESSLPTQRFVARVAKRCTTNNTTCNAQGGTVRISIGALDPIAVSTTGATASTSTSTTGNGAFRGELFIGAWTGLPSAWTKVANNGIANKNGSYLIAISHADTIAHNYLAQFHCEKETVTSAVPTSDAGSAITTGTGLTATGGAIASPFGDATGVIPLELSTDINQ